MKEFDKELHDITSEIEGFLLSGKVKAVAAIVVMDDGTSHTRIRFTENGRMYLLAGITLLKADLIEIIQNDPEGKK